MNAELKQAIDRLEEDEYYKTGDDDLKTADIKLVLAHVREPYLTTDHKGGFESALAAAHYFEDRFDQIRINFLGLGVARHKQDLEGVKFFLSQLELLTTPIAGMYEDPRP